MKNILLLSSMGVLFISLAFAQDMQYVSKKSGDTLFVKDDNEYLGSNTLYLLMKSDTSAPATRVYMLKYAGMYSLANSPQSSKIHRTIIMGPEQNLKTGSPATQPPIVTGDYMVEVGVGGGMNINKDLLVKNIDLEIGNAHGNYGGWAWFGFSGPNMRLEVENCIMEHTWWTWVGGPPADESIFFNNCYFVNLNGFPCRRNGGVVDFNGRGVTHQDTLSVQNCTHVNTQGTLYRFRDGYTVDRVMFNHNNFIDCAGYVLMNNGAQSNMIVTNNIFVNVQLQGYCNALQPADYGEIDMDSLPMGLVNLRVDSTFIANGAKFYADKNLAYWDPSLSNIVSTLNTNNVNSHNDWVSQMITMNSRTANLFADKTHYPLLTNGKWISKKPAFANTDNLFSTQLDVVKAYAIAAVDTTHDSRLDLRMPSWRQWTNPEVDNFVHADWPIPIDLSYTDADLLTAGLGGFPVGDLGWFPTQLATWKAQRGAELGYIDSVLTGRIVLAVHSTQALPQGFQLEQNYPNPFNPTTTIGYQLPKVSRVSLKVYDLLGREVATLVDGRQSAGSHVVGFNADELPSGVYFYSITADALHQARKMVLVK